MSTEDRFWEKVDKSGDCWEWTAGLRNGYGQFWLDGKNVGAHRVVMELEGNEIPDGDMTAIYVEYHSRDADADARAIGEMTEMLTDCGADEGLMWVGRGAEAIGNFKQIKHVFPELLNGVVGRRQQAEPGIRKLGTDHAVGDDRFDELLALYHRDLDAGGFEHFIFGHLGDNNVHVNIVPRNLAEYEAGKQLYLQWARAAVAMGGTVSAEPSPRATSC